jgi:hypothetical protein
MSGPAWRFLREPRAPRPLGVFRIGVSLLLLVQAWTLSEHLVLLLGNRGLAPWSVSEVLSSGWLPHIATVARAAQPWGLSARECIQGVGAVYVLFLGGLLLGWRTRSCAAGAWLIHTLLINSAPLFTYGFELFAHISLFYCLVMPVGAAYSLDVRSGRTDGAPSAEATLSLRVLQLHLCVVYFATGVEKAVGKPWRSGSAIWEAVMQPQFAQFDLSWLAWHPWVSEWLSWGTLVIEVGYALLIWPRQTRALWVALTLGLHAGIALFMGLWLFSAIMSVLTFSAFGWESLKREVVPAV